MSADKYPCIFSRQMETIVYIFTVLGGEYNSRNKMADGSWLEKISDKEISERIMQFPKQHKVQQSIM